MSPPIVVRLLTAIGTFAHSIDTYASQVYTDLMRMAVRYEVWIKGVRVTACINHQGSARILNLIRTLLHRAHYVELVRDTCAAVHSGTGTMDMDGMFDEIQRICSMGTDDMVMG
jgi:hypothetical protein